jgi:hypothetical protein
MWTWLAVIPLAFSLYERRKKVMAAFKPARVRSQPNAPAET